MNFDVKLFLKLKLITVACAIFYLASINAEQSYQTKNFTPQAVDPAEILTKLRDSANSVIAAYEEGKSTPNDLNAKQKLENAQEKFSGLVEKANSTPKIRTITGLLDNRAGVYLNLNLNNPNIDIERIKKGTLITAIESAIQDPRIKKPASPTKTQSTEDVFGSDEEGIDILNPKERPTESSIDDEFEQPEQNFTKSKTLADQQTQKLAPVKLRTPDNEDTDEPDSLREDAFFPQEPVARPEKKLFTKPNELAEDPELPSEQPKSKLQEKRQEQMARGNIISSARELPQLRPEEVSLQEGFSRQPIPTKTKAIQKISTETPIQPDNPRIKKNAPKGAIIQNPPYKSVLKDLMEELNKPEKPQNEVDSLLELMDREEQQSIVEEQPKKQILIPPLKIPERGDMSYPLAPRQQTEKSTFNTESEIQDPESLTKLPPLAEIKRGLPADKPWTRPNTATSQTAQNSPTTSPTKTPQAGIMLKTRSIAAFREAARHDTEEALFGRQIKFESPKTRRER